MIKQISVSLCLSALMMFNVACAPSATEEVSSGFFGVDEAEKGTPIDNSLALDKIQEFCGNAASQKSFLARFNRVDFQAGYVEHFDGSGFGYPIAASGEQVFRSGAGELYSKNGMNMNPPSMRFDHNQLIYAECAVTLASLQGQNKYQQVEARTGAAFKGNAADASIDISDCLAISMNRDAIKHTVAFCPSAFYTDAITSGAGPDSRSQMAMQAH